MTSRSDIFSRDLIAIMRRRPDEGRVAVCRRIAKALANRRLSIQYALDIGEIVVGSNIALVRLVWRENKRVGAIGKVSCEPGIDLSPRSRWEVANYRVPGVFHRGAMILPTKMIPAWR